MSQIVIKAENLTKKYLIGHHSGNGSYVALRDVITQNVRNTWHKTRDLIQGKPIVQGDTLEEVWALRDVTFDVRQGEVIGIIGPNGAGKSTLLKVLSRITEPTMGRVRLKGRVASLLEVGTGFHPELSGRENIFLNAAILGMTRAETKGKFDEIVAFADVERFLDTPVKRYSSGMYVRLAFAVAAHLEPEILLVDEVLAVGDAAFQKKCLGKIGDIANSGRTVLLVSHNIGVVAELCQNVLWIDQGCVRAHGQSRDVVARYIASGAEAKPQWVRPNGGPQPRVRLQMVRLLSQDGEPIDLVGFERPFMFEILYDVHRPVAGCTLAFRIRNSEGSTVLVSSERDTTDAEERTREVGRYRAVCNMPGELLRHGLYHLTVGAYIENVETIDRHENMLTFEISPVGCPAIDGRAGVIAPVLPWRVDYEGAFLTS